MARPRKYEPGQEPTTAERMRATRQRKKERGEQLVRVWLDQAESEALASFAAENGVSSSEALRLLVQKIRPSQTP